MSKIVCKHRMGQFVVKWGEIKTEPRMCPNDTMDILLCLSLSDRPADYSRIQFPSLHQRMLCYASFCRSRMARRWGRGVGVQRPIEIQVGLPPPGQTTRIARWGIATIFTHTPPERYLDGRPGRGPIEVSIRDLDTAGPFSSIRAPKHDPINSALFNIPRIHISNMAVTAPGVSHSQLLLSFFFSISLSPVCVLYDKANILVLN